MKSCEVVQLEGRPRSIRRLPQLEKIWDILGVRHDMDAGLVVLAFCSQRLNVRMTAKPLVHFRLL